MPRWSKVRLILMREIRDQLRDRRTLFMIAVLPLLLYPLLGMSFFQIAQFMREKAVRVLVVGATDFAGLPALIENKGFAARLFNPPAKANLLTLSFKANRDAERGGTASAEDAKLAVQRGDYDVALYFPPDFAARLEKFRTALTVRPPDALVETPRIPSPVVMYNAAKENSQLAFVRVSEAIDKWTEAVGQQNLRDSQMPITAARPFELANNNVAGEGRSKAAMWAKILPFVVLLWALTGAFYPAVDLCAGEKERGTLETLLSSPAERIEIVWGKLLTVMLFSCATAVLNLASMGMTGALVLKLLPNMAPPPALAIVWLLVALLPMSALFSALCLALAAFARSTKEGQYYLMPLMLVTMPLTLLPMSPGVELNFGNSLVPVTGVVLVLRTLLEGEYVLALTYLPIVAGVTLCCCLLAIRWATEQFNTESVLFRESERLDFGLWVKHLLRERQATPSVAEALACAVILLMLRFFIGLSARVPQSFADLAMSNVVMQFVVMLTPAVLMTAMLTRSPAQTLLLRVPRLATIPAAVLLAVAAHPVIMVLGEAIRHLYPIENEGLAKFSAMFAAGNLWTVLIVVAVIPAICEEMAFRGFILSGLRHLGHKRRAIVVSSMFFGISHFFLQQSIVATLVGTLIGYLAVQTGSLLPGVVFHMVHNGLMVLFGRMDWKQIGENDLLYNVSVDGSTVLYRWPWVVIGGWLMVRVVLWLRHLPGTVSPEESLQETIDREAGHGVRSLADEIEAAPLAVGRPAADDMIGLPV